MGPLKHPLQTAEDQALMGVDTSRRICACGRFMGPRALTCRRCVRLRALARYNRTGKYATARARYRNSAKGRAEGERSRARRIFVGENYQGRAHTIEQAAVIRHHVKERIRAFIERQQTRTEVEGVTPCAVSFETKP